VNRHKHGLNAESRAGAKRGRAGAHAFARHSVQSLCLLLASCTASEESAPDAGPSAFSQADAAAASALPAEASVPAASAPSAMQQAPSAVVTSPGSTDAATPINTADAAAEAQAFLGLAAPPSGFRLKTRGAEIPAGSDRELCEVSEVPGPPGQEYIIGTTEVANGRASHHLIVSAALPDSPAEKKLRELALGTQVPCVTAEIEFGQGLISVGASQTTLAKAVYPEGVGIRLRGGQRLVFDYHYFNYTDAPLMAESAAAFHAIDPAQVHNIASAFSFTNMTIDTPPNARGTFVASCRFKHDLMLQGIGRHTHTSGTDFTVWYEGGPKHGQQIWQSLDWEHDTGFYFPEPLLFKADQGFKFACSYRNDSTKPLRFGIRAKDEMCILTGAIWSPTAKAEIAPESCVITWVDAQGIGHDARDNGGPPKATPDEVLACAIDTIGFSFLDSCVGCICDNCARALTRCNADADCKAIVDCRMACQSEGAKCDESCESVLFEHSAGVGMATQVGECLVVACGTSCAIGQQKNP
jgi:hypothetical protein